MNKLLESQKRGQTDENGRSKDDKAWDLSGIICFRFHKEGYSQDNRPFGKEIRRKLRK